MAVVERLFPETAEVVKAAKPGLRKATQESLRRLVMEPASEPGQRSHMRGTERLRRLLTGQ